MSASSASSYPSSSSRPPHPQASAPSSRTTCGATSRRRCGRRRWRRRTRRGPSPCAASTSRRRDRRVDDADRVSADRAAQDPDADGRYFVGISISVRAPDALLLDGGAVVRAANQSDWRVRAYAVSGVGRTDDDDDADGDGDGDDDDNDSDEDEDEDEDDERAELTRKAQDDDGSAYVETDDAATSAPHNCTRELHSWGAAWKTTEFVPLDAFNGTELYASALTSKDRGDDESLYARAVRQPWPVMLVYYSSSGNTTKKEQARLTCVRARNIAEGSEQPGASAAGRSRGVLSAWALSVVGVVAFLAL
ncbi:hypothetical protein F5B20DRAFT_592896, partial [Whalleya microplaca]